VTARVYQIRVRGRIPADELMEFEGVSAAVQPTETVLTGRVVDQAALQGILQRLHLLGLDLIEVRRCPDMTADPSHRLS
jgi:hypothetical protein